MQTPPKDQRKADPRSLRAYSFKLRISMPIDVRENDLIALARPKVDPAVVTRGAITTSANSIAAARRRPGPERSHDPTSALEPLLFSSKTLKKKLAILTVGQQAARQTLVAARDSRLIRGDAGSWSRISFAMYDGIGKELLLSFLLVLLEGKLASKRAGIQSNELTVERAKIAGGGAGSAHAHMPRLRVHRSAVRAKICCNQIWYVHATAFAVEEHSTHSLPRADSTNRSHKISHSLFGLTRLSWPNSVVFALLCRFSRKYGTLDFRPDNGQRPPAQTAQTQLTGRAGGGGGSPV
ncbi:hypothetical protein EVAR_41839_1 [Eumeta japonica]|uniref:Uncharacterized protein n=1 Tax=Eumeta variegata TaxID=151549 RepID=A0A4C1XCQ7_EUMVA|nr:hypothetical protein EVAR_41839_1 [Eumeta japonica]